LLGPCPGGGGGGGGGGGKRRPNPAQALLYPSIVSALREKRGLV